MLQCGWAWDPADLLISPGVAHDSYGSAGTGLEVCACCSSSVTCDATRMYGLAGSVPVSVSPQVAVWVGFLSTALS